MDLTSKKIANDKNYIIVDSEIYTKTISRFYQEFREITVLTCSSPTFIKHNSFYIGPPTESGKETCLCMKCQNRRISREIINFRKTEKLLPHDSVTKSGKLQDSLPTEELKRKHLEFSASKLTAHYVFENKTETYFKDGVEKSHERHHVLMQTIK